jgi:hypothetical protein
MHDQEFIELPLIHDAGTSKVAWVRPQLVASVVNIPKTKSFPFGGTAVAMMTGQTFGVALGVNDVLDLVYPYREKP